jgi:hypothetical protein
MHLAVGIRVGEGCMQEVWLGWNFMEVQGDLVRNRRRCQMHLLDEDTPVAHH